MVPSGRQNAQTSARRGRTAASTSTRTRPGSMRPSMRPPRRSTAAPSRRAGEAPRRRRRRAPLDDGALGSSLVAPSMVGARMQAVVTLAGVAVALEARGRSPLGRRRRAVRRLSTHRRPGPVHRSLRRRSPSGADWVAGGLVVRCRSCGSPIRAQSPGTRRARRRARRRRHRGRRYGRLRHAAAGVPPLGPARVGQRDGRPRSLRIACRGRGPRRPGRLVIGDTGAGKSTVAVAALAHGWSC